MFGVKRRAATKVALADAQIKAAAQYARDKVLSDADVTIKRELGVPGLSEDEFGIIREKFERYRMGVEKAYGERYAMRDVLRVQDEMVRLGAMHFVSARNMSIISGSYANATEQRLG